LIKQLYPFQATPQIIFYIVMIVKKSKIWIVSAHGGGALTILRALLFFSSTFSSTSLTCLVQRGATIFSAMDCLV
jgi:hypothetical protein